MQSLSIDTGEIRLAINNDETRIIVLKPNDAIFAEKFYKMLGSFQEKFSEYQTKANAIEANVEEDANGIPLNTGDRIDLLKEVCTYSHERIDDLLGSGSARVIFGDALDIDAIIQFFDGVRPFMEKARADKIAKYTNARPKRK